MNAAEYYADNKTDREQWRREQAQACMWCGTEGFPNGLEIHEMVPRSRASRSWAWRANYLLLCQKCHARHFASMPLAKQLAVKLTRDKANYNLAAIHEILGHDSVAWTDIWESQCLLRLPPLRPKQYPKF